MPLSLRHNLYQWHKRPKGQRINPIETRRLRQGPATEADLQEVGMEPV